jgi:hypothetical protein
MTRQTRSQARVIADVELIGNVKVHLLAGQLFHAGNVVTGAAFAGVIAPAASDPVVAGLTTDVVVAASVSERVAKLSTRSC